MRPVIERIAQSVGDGSRPCHKLVVGIGFAGAVVLGDAVGSHGSPLVVIAFQPDLAKVAELPVVRNVLRGKMAVVVQDRLPGRGIMIEPPARLSLEKKMFSDEFHVPIFQRTINEGRSITDDQLKNNQIKRTVKQKNSQFEVAKPSPSGYAPPVFRFPSRCGARGRPRSRLRPASTLR